MSKTSRVSQSESGFRQSMAWLHTWCGLWFSWLLYAVFLTGTLAVFDEPITHWMGPEHALEEAAAEQAQAHAAPVSNRAQRLAFGMAYMAQHHATADMWELWPINRGQDNGLTAYWFDKSGGYAAMELDPLTGAPLPPSPAPPLRGTQGGHHFVDFHYELHAGKIGLWIVGVTAMAMLVALVSGVVTHKRIFKDFFTFRPKKGQRSWLDAHNAVAVLTLPFLFMIAYTGLAISGRSFV
ncbi:PepSY-associated TM helix domain-containing protein, partial [Variovorax sp. HJSM1_2]|uniref:PepSY-associated TM helix domain-containing protein n=1 Tax=Variovorax sp. HJSM1_2 TaxID=3366263 RepID=UPI003BBC0340